MQLLESFKLYFNQHFAALHLQGKQLLLAVSGGLDSVVMVDLCAQSGIDFSIVHCNFQLRGAESQRDELFVQQLAIRYNKPFLVKVFDTSEYAVEHHLSIQEAARKLRYEWFQELLVSNPQFAAVATAHHADDNIETVLMNIFRGTGLAGLHGILPVLGNIIRPLLFAQRSEIETYAKALQLPWVEDSSNVSDKYTRNFFRHQVIPLVQQFYPQAAQNILANIARWTEAEILYNSAIKIILSKLVEQKGNEMHIPVLKWKKLVPLQTITYELMKDYGFQSTQTQEIIKLLDAQSGSSMSSNTHHLIKNRNWMIIAPHQNDLVKHIVVDEHTDVVSYVHGTIQIKRLSAGSFVLPNSSSVAALDADKVAGSILLRQWKQGDYFYPLGMDKKKKLSKFFIDQKLSKTDKEKVWVVVSNQRIIWVVGYRIDNRFKVTATTKNVLLLTVES
jgi:tRNA(Ile)-lysidine synthase